MANRIFYAKASSPRKSVKRSANQLAIPQHPDEFLHAALGGGCLDSFAADQSFFFQAGLPTIDHAQLTATMDFSSPSSTSDMLMMRNSMMDVDETESLVDDMSSSASSIERKPKQCYVCSRVETPKRRIGHRLQAQCDGKSNQHAGCKLICNSCEDFFRRHFTNGRLDNNCDGPLEIECLYTRSPSGNRKICQKHRFQRCLDANMRLVPKDMIKTEISLAMPLTPRSSDSTLPFWERAVIPNFADPVHWNSFLNSINVEQSSVSESTLPEFLQGSHEYSNLMMRGVEFAKGAYRAINAPKMLQLSLFMTLDFASSPQDHAILSSDSAYTEALDMVPVCVDVQYITIQEGRIRRPSGLNPCCNFPWIMFDKYRVSISSNSIATITPMEVTQPPPFVTAAVAPERDVHYTLRSLLPMPFDQNGPRLYHRRAGDRTPQELTFGQEIRLDNGDILSIYSAEKAERIAWRVRFVSTKGFEYPL